MIRSMTGFGRASFEVEAQTFSMEIRALNHRHLDVQVRLPRSFSFLEMELRSLLKARFARGKIDLSVTQPAGERAAPSLQVDAEAAQRYLSAASELERVHGVSGQLDVATLLSLPGVATFSEPVVAEQGARAALMAALEDAVGAVFAMRLSEGEALARDLSGRFDRLQELAEALEARTGDVQKTVRERLRARMEMLGRETGLTDEARFYHELALAADRLDVSEELVRLRSHVDQCRALFESDEPVGRRFDFLIQEMGREVNTVGSKGSDAGIAHLVVDLKSELEKLREQVQNVE
ncbi:MAG: YicC/YloC family endoribonuclease [Myxococcota bacterium]